MMRVLYGGIASAVAMLLLLACSASKPARSSTCRLVRLRVRGSVARSGDVRVDLGEADNPSSPTAWQGPVKISVNGEPGCTASDEVGIVERPLLLGPSVLYVSTYSGSEGRLFAVSLKTCRVEWQSKPYVGNADYSDGRLTLGVNHIPVALDSGCNVKRAH